MITCTFEHGNKASLRHVTVGTIVVDKSDKVLLVKRAPHIFKGNTYSIPGGFLDRDEDTRGGALRELVEETGLRGKISLLFRINDSPQRPKEDRQNVDVLYIVEIVGGELKHDDEVDSIEWFSQDDLPKDDEFAFDHRESILRYFAYRKKPFEVPIIG